MVPTIEEIVCPVVSTCSMAGAKGIGEYDGSVVPLAVFILISVENPQPQINLMLITATVTPLFF